MEAKHWYCRKHDKVSILPSLITDEDETDVAHNLL